MSKATQLVRGSIRKRTQVFGLQELNLRAITKKPTSCEHVSIVLI